MVTTYRNEQHKDIQQTTQRHTTNNTKTYKEQQTYKEKLKENTRNNTKTYSEQHKDIQCAVPVL